MLYYATISHLSRGSTLKQYFEVYETALAVDLVQTPQKSYTWLLMVYSMDNFPENCL